MYVVDGEGEHKKLLLRGTRLSAPSWSPDGRLIAYSRRCKSLENGDVFCDLAVMNSDGRQRRTLLRDEGPLESVLWSPSSQTVFFTGYLTQGHQGINRVDVRTGAARTVVAGGVSTPVSYLVV